MKQRTILQYLNVITNMAVEDTFKTVASSLKKLIEINL